MRSKYNSSCCCCPLSFAHKQHSHSHLIFLLVPEPRGPAPSVRLSLSFLATAMAFLRFLAVAMLAGLAADLCAATDHIVGANHGWNPNINYSLWSGNHTFYVGDLVSFRYQKGTHNVFEVNETGYDNCTMDGVAGNWTSGKDFIPLPEPRRYYFICGNGFCLQGMKVAVTVHPLPHNASADDGSRRRGGAGSPEAAAASGVRGAAAWLALLAIAVAAAAA